MMKLRKIAHARTGDKGDISNISVIAYNESDYEKLHSAVTADRVKQWFAHMINGEVTRYDLPKLGALNFVLTRALGGGVTQSLSLDMHGKTLSSLLLDMEIN